MRKWVVGSAAWERRANALARESIRITPCVRCKAPTLDGYCCRACGCECGTGDLACVCKRTAAKAASS